MQFRSPSPPATLPPLPRSYPHFNPQEMLEVAQLHKALVARAKGGAPTPIVTFNAELDRIRTGALHTACDLHRWHQPRMWLCSAACSTQHI